MRLAITGIRRRIAGRLGAAVLGCLLVTAVPAGEPLSLETLLDRSAGAVPRILEAREKVRASEGKRLGAEGAFDRSFESEGSQYLSGFYDGGFLDSKLAQPLRNMGGELYAGYRISDGRFPVYEDEFVTLSGGEIAFGGVLSLLRDREYDRRRFGLDAAELEIQLAELDLLLTQVGVQRDAMAAYWTWVAAGQRLAVLEDLLGLAEERVTGLSVRLNEGDVAQIDIVENAQNILRRRSLVMGARRDLENAAVALSIFNRDPEGKPLLPTLAELPPEMRLPEASALDDPATELRDALARQAELQLIDTRLELAEARRRLGENELRPRVDLGLKLARDFGGGSETRDGTDLVLGFEFSVPLERRKARGDIAAAEAEIRAQTYARQRVEEQLRAEVARLANIIEVNREVARYASLEVDQARRLEEAEWIRFEQGASNFFLLNLREQATADAQLREITALAGYYRAVADYRVVTTDLEALRIRP